MLINKNPENISIPLYFYRRPFSHHIAKRYVFFCLFFTIWPSASSFEIENIFPFIIYYFIDSKRRNSFIIRQTLNVRTIRTFHISRMKAILSLVTEHITTALTPDLIVLRNEIAFSIYIYIGISRSREFSQFINSFIYCLTHCPTLLQSHLPIR